MVEFAEMEEKAKEAIKYKKELETILDQLTFWQSMRQADWIQKLQSRYGGEYEREGRYCLAENRKSETQEKNRKTTGRE